ESPFQNPLYKRGAISFFTSRERDKESGLYFYRARYLDPRIGRFLTEDPIGFEGGDVNLYNYVWANPLNWIDPSGLLSYLMGRGLQMGSLGNYVSHNYIASNAQYIGDPNATIHSYGQNNAGNVGRVDQNTTGFSSTTHAADVAHWLSLSNNNYCTTSSPDVSPIPASDADVDRTATSVIEDQDYSAVAGPFGANSNSGAQAVANRAAGRTVPTPGRGRISPGAGSAGEIRFRP
ncbi:MAG: RHS repeat-associated core domain-containing protein, partial [bacterium]